MTLWPTLDSLRSIELSVVGSMRPEEVLYEFDGPCIYTTRTPHGTLVLAYLSEDLEDEGLLRFVVSTTSRATTDAMKEGVVSVREALDRGSLWLVDLDYSYQPRRAYTVSADELPEDALPLRTTMLWSHLEPVMVVKLKGAELLHGRIPSAAFAQAALIGSKCLKPVFEWAARALRKDTSGRPPNWLRHLYGLPAQRIAPGSLEVAFGEVVLETDGQKILPFHEGDAPPLEEIQESAWSALRDGLSWAMSGQDVPSGDVDEMRWLAILQSLKGIAPSSTGPVTSIEVGGRMLGTTTAPYKLDRESTKRIRTGLTELKKQHETQLRVFNGRVRDLDLDKLTVILRDVEGVIGDLHLDLDDEGLLETAREAHYQELEVSVAARSEDKRTWTATDIEYSQSKEVGKD